MCIRDSLYITLIIDPASRFDRSTFIAAPKALAFLLGWKDNINGVIAKIPPITLVTLVATDKNFLLSNLLIPI